MKQKSKRFFIKNKKAVLTVCTALVLIIAAAAAIPKAVRTATRPDGIFVPIVMYHSVCRDDEMLCDYVISPMELEKDLSYLSRNGYTPIFIEQLIDYVHIDKKLPEKPIILTFDDGFYNNLEYVLPLLEKYDFKATVSVVGSYTEAEDISSDHNPRYSYLTSEEIKELYLSCHIEIANHSYDLHSLDERKGATINSEESYEDYRNVLLSDLSKAQKLLADNCGILPRVFTYPYGLVSEPSMRIVKNAGFMASLGVEEKPNYITKDPDCLFDLNRYNRPSGVSTKDFFERVLEE